MAQDKFDLARLDRDGYDWDNPLQLARLQRTVEDFMTLIRTNEVRCPNDQGMLDKFCNLVNDADIWQLAQMVAPEFRSAKEDRPGDADAGRGTASLDYVLDRLVMLPLPRNDKNVLTSEQDLLNRRHKQWVEYVVTGGRASEAATSVEAAEVEERVSRVQKAIGEVQAEYPTAPPRNSERKRRDDPNKVDDGEVSEAGGTGGPREHAPRNASLETEELGEHALRSAAGKAR